MSKEASFDIVSEVDMQELTNAVTQAEKEIATRFDFKGTKSTIELKKSEIVIVADDEYRLSALIDILQSKMIKRGISIKALTYGKVEPASGGMVRQVIGLIQGLESEHAKTVVKLIKDSKVKVQASIQGNQVRVSGKNRDDLQQIIQILKQQDLPVDLQFTNYR